MDSLSPQYHKPLIFFDYYYFPLIGAYFRHVACLLHHFSAKFDEAEGTLKAQALGKRQRRVLAKRQPSRVSAAKKRKLNEVFRKYFPVINFFNQIL